MLKKKFFNFRSVNENEVDDEEIQSISNGAISLKKSSDETGSYHSSKSNNNDQKLNKDLSLNCWNEKNDIDSEPIKFSLKQKMMIWTGLADPKKLELQERIRLQIKRDQEKQNIKNQKKDDFNVENGKKFLKN